MKGFLALLAAGAGVALTAACAPHAPRPPRSDALEAEALPAREPLAQAAWAGRTYEELVTVWGRPRLVMSIPGGHRPHELVLVYGRNDRRFGCVHAFTLNNGPSREPDPRAEILGYFCL